MKYVSVYSSQYNLPFDSVLFYNLSNKLVSELLVLRGLVFVKYSR